MSTETNHTDTDPQAHADYEAVMRSVIDGTLLDPEVAHRVDERAQRIMEEIRQEHGELDEETVNQLLRDVHDES